MKGDFEEYVARYKPVLDALNETVFILDTKGHFVYVNKVGLQTFKYTKPEARKLRFDKVVHEDYSTQVEKSFRDRLNGKVVPKYRIKAVTKDGVVGVYEISGNAIKIHGKIVGVLLLAKDVTAEDYAMQSLEESEEMYKTLVKTTPEAVVAVDLKGDFIYVSPKMLKLHGYSRPEELLGKSCFKLIAPENRKKAREGMRRISKKKITKTVEHKFLRKDGTTFLGELTVTSLKDAHGRSRGCITTLRDITARKRAEEALKESELKFRNLFENSTDAVFLADAKSGVTLDCNRAACRLLGMSRKQLIGLHQSKLHPPEKVEIYKKIFRDHVKKEKAFTEDLLIQQKSGKKVPVNISATVMNIPGRKIIQGVFRDITEEKKAMERLRQLNEFLSDILANAPVGIVTTDTEGSVTSANKTLLEILGSPSESATKKFNVLKLKPLMKYGISDAFKTVLTEGRKLHLDKVYYKSVWGKESIADIRIVPLKNPDGKVNGSIGIITDVTLQAKLEKEFSDIKEHLETVINGIDEAIVVISPKYRIISHNTAFLDSLRKPQKTVKNKHCYKIIHGYSHPCRRCVVREMFKTGKPVGDVHYHLEKEGKIYHEVKAYPLTDSTGKLTQAVYLFRDVTEREVLYEKVIQAKEAAENLAKMKSDFASIASHELKTPLAIIKGYAEVLSDGGLGSVNKKQRKKLENIITNIDRLDKLVGKLLDISRLESSELKLHLDEVSMETLIDSVLSDMGRIIEKKRLSLRVSYSRKLPKVRVDATLIKQVLFNLVDNAVKFTPADGVIRITVKKKGEFLVVSVSDTGIGIPRRKLDKIGHRFYQADSSVSRQYKGAGLGIAICKRILNLHGGVLKLKSRFGKGTMVSFTLPVKPTHPDLTLF